MGFFKKIFSGLKKTQEAISDKIVEAFTGQKNELTDEFFDELEEIFIGADIGVEASLEIVEQLRKEARKEKIRTIVDVKEFTRKIIADILTKDAVGVAPKSDPFPVVYTIIGVNGVGKTTSIGRLAHFYKQQGKEVVLAAGDTFRAAATEQLDQWATRAGVRIVKQGQGADSASVVFDAIKSCQAKKADVLIIDTAGRLHNNINLMKELEKIGKIVAREWPDAKQENLLVLDATTGQNAISQAKLFNDAVPLTGLILTKLDGTAKGGVVINIKKQLKLPVKFIGVGEALDDLEIFDPESFAKGIL
ncbi:MAG: signal recognition particle-docking protein FtsY [Firmicutes bacterium]|nr:signal recognition particle-docking protein FtsY [Bacillota bacterium]